MQVPIPLHIRESLDPRLAWATESAFGATTPASVTEDTTPSVGRFPESVENTIVDTVEAESLQTARSEASELGGT